MACLGLLLGGCGTGTETEQTRDATATAASIGGAVTAAVPRVDLAASPAVTPPAGVGSAAWVTPAAMATACREAIAQAGLRGPDVAGEPHLVTVGELNLRAGPGTDCPILTTLGFGSVVAVDGAPVERDGYTWRRLRTPTGDGFSIVSALQPLPEQQPTAVPVLMYHVMGEKADRFTVTRSRFEEHLLWLRGNGYVTITPTDLLNNLEEERPLPAKPVMITIDDYWIPAPGFMELMRWNGFRGTFFLPNEHALTESEVVEMARHGEVCGHTATHQYLFELSPAEERWEIEDNKAMLEEIIGRPVICFAYPFGSHSDATVDLLTEAGHRIAFDSTGGVAPIGEGLDVWHVPRIEVIGDWSLEEFAASIEGGES